MKTRIKNLTRFKITLNLLWSLVLIFFLAGLLTMAMFIIQPTGMRDIGANFIDSNLLTPLLNFIPIFSAMLLFFFLFNNVALAAGLVGFTILTLSIMNRQKILLRNDPLFPWDFTIGAEVFAIVRNFPVYQFWLAGLFVAACIVVTFTGFFMIKSTRIKPLYRAGLVATTIFIMYSVNSTVYHDAALIRSLPVRGNVFHPVNTFNSRGFVYSFIFAHNTQRLTMPSDFNMAVINEKYADFIPVAYEEKNGLPRPHIIMIMSEAFSEMGMDSRISFEGFDYDPQYYWRQFIVRPETIHGQLVVPNAGGGTGDTEFDVLTALNTRALRGVPYTYMLVVNYFESLTSALNSLGYRSIAMHPGFNWFYNRQNVYRFFGFEHFYYIGYFEYYHFKGPYISEWATMDKLLEIWENHLENYPGVPLFNFTVTIQNHGPYANMYGLTENNFATEMNFTDHEMNQLTNYFHGMRDQDTELNRLIRYFESSPEPVVLIYFSDHLPGLSANIMQTFYPDTGEDTLENLTRMHRVPFIIWQNPAAAQITPLTENFNTLPIPDNMIIGSNFLGAYLLELLGFKRLNPLFDFVNELRAVFPVILEDRAFSPEGIPSLEKPDEERTVLITYRDWQFNRVFN